MQDIASIHLVWKRDNILIPRNNYCGRRVTIPECNMLFCKNCWWSLRAIPKFKREDLDYEDDDADLEIKLSCKNCKL